MNKYQIDKLGSVLLLHQHIAIFLLIDNRQDHPKVCQQANVLGTGVKKVETEAGVTWALPPLTAISHGKKARLAYGVQFGAGQFISKSVNHHISQIRCCNNTQARLRLHFIY